MEWMVVLNRIVLDLDSDSTIRSGDVSSTLFLSNLEAGLRKKINIGEVGLHPRNVSLIQKSTLALGFHQADGNCSWIFPSLHLLELQMKNSIGSMALPEESVGERMQTQWVLVNPLSDLKYSSS